VHWRNKTCHHKRNFVNYVSLLTNERQEYIYIYTNGLMGSILFLTKWAEYLELVNYLHKDKTYI